MTIYVVSIPKWYLLNNIKISGTIPLDGSNPDASDTAISNLVQWLLAVDLSAEEISNHKMFIMTSILL